MTETRNRILDLMKRQGHVTIQSLSDELNMARTTVKEHLRLLEKEGWIYGAKEKRDMGRPVMTYSLTGSGKQLFPNAQGQMLSRALRFIKDELGESGLHDFFKRFWAERYEEARRRLDVYDKDDDEGYRAELYKILEEQHFMPEIEWGQVNGSGNEDQESPSQKDAKRADHTLVIKECNCPFPEAVGETRLPCQLEAEFFQKLLGGRLERTSYIPDGYNACTYHISLGKSESGNR